MLVSNEQKQHLTAEGFRYWLLSNFLCLLASMVFPVLKIIIGRILTANLLWR
jgi:hypothetical protein